MQTRREFMTTAGAALLVSRAALSSQAVEPLPDLVIGVLSDIHIALGPHGDSMRATTLFRHALEYFRDCHVDGVLVAGDLTNAGLETELEAVAEAWFSVFPRGTLPDGSPVSNLMHYGDHDAESRFYDEALKARFKAAGCAVPRSLSQGELRRECWEHFFGEPWPSPRHFNIRSFLNGLKVDVL